MRPQQRDPDSASPASISPSPHVLNKAPRPLPQNLEPLLLTAPSVGMSYSEPRLLPGGAGPTRPSMAPEPAETVQGPHSSSATDNKVCGLKATSHDTSLRGPILELDSLMARPVHAGLGGPGSPSPSFLPPQGGVTKGSFPLGVRTLLAS